MLEQLLNGLLQVLTVERLLLLILGGALGYLGGAIPGISASIALGLILPLTFGMDPISAIVMLVAVYQGAEYAGAIPAILINTPGTPGAVATTFDGHPMAQRGEAGKALSISIASSATGALVSTVLLILTASYVADVALAFGPMEFFALAVVGLSLVAVLGEGSVLKSLLAVVLGLLVTTVGVDPITGTPRFVLFSEALEGIPFVPLLIGLFAFSEALFMMEKAHSSGVRTRQYGTTAVPWRELLSFRWTLIRSSIIGYIIGAIPGAGTAIASLTAYAMEKRGSREPEQFGRGHPVGIAAPESANNAAVAGVIGPLLALGLPGSASAAILIGALQLYGLRPGPLLFVETPQIPYAIFASLLVGVPVLFAMGKLGLRLWAKVAEVPAPTLSVVLIATSVLGAYSFQNSMYGVWVMLVFGVIGYGMRKVDVPLAPFILAVVLGGMIETNLRRALIASRGDVSYFLNKPLALALLAVALLILVGPSLRSLWRKESSASGPTVPNPEQGAGEPNRY